MPLCGPFAGILCTTQAGPSGLRVKWNVAPLATSSKASRGASMMILLKPLYAAQGGLQIVRYGIGKGLKLLVRHLQLGGALLYTLLQFVPNLADFCPQEKIAQRQKSPSPVAPPASMA